MPIRAALLASVLTILALLASATSPSFGQESDQRVDAAELARIDRSWNRYWREVSPFYVKHEKAFVCVPGYDRRLPSSAGLTPADYQKQTARQVVYRDDRGREQIRVEVKPDAEALAVTHALTEIKPGAYGHILSGLITRIEDGQTLLLEDIWLVDAQAVREEKQEKLAEVRKQAWSEVEERLRGLREGRRERRDTVADLAGQMADYIEWSYAGREQLANLQREADFRRRTWKILGYQTSNLNQGDRWPSNQSLQLVIVSVSEDHILAIPAAKIGSGLNELEMLECLESRTLNKGDFVDLYTNIRAEHRRDYIPHILAELEGWDRAAREDNPGDEVRLAE